jgi:hypothetical protein
VKKNGGRLTNKKEKVMATLKNAKTSKRKKEDDKKKINK